MYNYLAVLNGGILAIMIFLNELLASIIGPYISTLVFHVLGLILIVSIGTIKKIRFSNLRKIPILFFLPGVLGVIVILLNNICIPQIGITLAIGVSLFGQLVMSSLVEHFGLFGMPVNKVKKEKILGFSIISIGIIMMVTM